MLCALPAVFALPTWADVGAGVRLTRLRYELVDLGSIDGSTPCIKLTGQSFTPTLLGNCCAGLDPCGQPVTFTTPAAWSWSRLRSTVQHTLDACSGPFRSPLPLLCG